MLREQIEIDARLVVVAFEKALGDQRREIAVADEVGSQQRHVRFVAHGPVEASARRDVRLAADDRREPCIARCVVKLHRAVHDAVVGQGDAGRAVLGRAAAKAIDAARAVEERIFRVNVKMDETVQ